MSKQLKLLTVAGSDASGGAGIQADLKVFHSLGVYGLSVITALTAQNTKGVLAVQSVSPECVVQQLAGILSDIAVDSVKVGMLHDAHIVRAVFDLLALHGCDVVLDPVVRSSSGRALLTNTGLDLLIEKLGCCKVVTPNAEELALLSRALSNEQEVVAQAEALARLGSITVIVTGGHSTSDENIIVYPNGKTESVAFERVNSRHTHGTGCVFSSALATYLAAGHAMKDACRLAADFVTRAVRFGALHPLSAQGVSPVQVAVDSSLFP